MGPEKGVGSHYDLGSHVLMFFGFLRAGEAVAPDNSDFDPTQHLTYRYSCGQCIKTHLPPSKYKAVQD